MSSNFYSFETLISDSFVKDNFHFCDLETGEYYPIAKRSLSLSCYEFELSVKIKVAENIKKKNPF